MTDTETLFTSLGVSDALVRTLADSGITHATPIQAAAIPPALEGRDLVGIAQTGTGKTLAFALPMLMTLNMGEQGLVLAPTRELAGQIAETFTKLGARVVVLVGGEPYHRQIQRLRARPAIIVATPGRLADHLHQRTMNLRAVRVVVLDEADRMLDMGFAPKIQAILSQVPEVRQTLLFSATMPAEIADLARNYQRDPVTVEIAPQGTVADRVDQEVAFVPAADRGHLLRKVMYDNTGSILVFARTRHGARKLARFIEQDGHAVAELHSDRTLNQRREALARFKSGAARILVATDIAARGIDVKEITLVVNYDLPDQTEDYVHRIGRTGRAGAAGRAITFAAPDQIRDLVAIERLMQAELPVSALSTVPTPARPVQPTPGNRSRTAKAPRRPQAPRGPRPESSADGGRFESRSREDRPARSDRPAYNRDNQDRPARDNRDRSDRPAYNRDNQDRPARDNRDRSDRPAYNRDNQDRPARDNRPAYSRDNQDRPARDNRDRSDRPAYSRDNQDRPARDGRAWSPKADQAPTDRPKSFKPKAAKPFGAKGKSGGPKSTGPKSTGPKFGGPKPSYGTGGTFKSAPARSRRTK